MKKRFTFNEGQFSLFRKYVKINIFNKKNYY
jgi:hypothetical protein